MTLLQEGRRARRGAGRGVLRTLANVLIVAGSLLLVDAGLTVLWQEPLSALYNRLQQDRLAGQLEDIGRVEPTPIEQRALAALPDETARLAFQARALRRRVKEAQPIARIRLKRIGKSLVVVEGTDGDSLRKGPGHYPSTPFPGAPGTVAIAGHRTTYGAPFRRLDRMRKGDEVEVDMPYGRFVYEVERTRIVDPSDVSVIRRVSYDRLVLTACHPLYSAAQRIVLFARLVRSERSAGLI